MHKGMRHAALAVFTLAGLAAAPPAGAAGPLDLYYDRTVMVAADRRCRLFSGPTAAALAAGAAQARNAALRAGADRDRADQTARNATAKAAAFPCAGKDIQTAAARVRDAFSAFARLTRMDYPGERRKWTADRATSRRVPTWRLFQTAPFGGGQLTFGLSGVGEAGALTAVADFGPQAPYTARLVMRDAGRTSGPYLPGGAATALERRLPPRDVVRVFTATSRQPAPAELAPDKQKGATRFEFPMAALDAMAALDPRDAVAVEFAYAGGGRDTVRTAYVEIGDLTAARAFLAVR